MDWQKIVLIGDTIAPRIWQLFINGDRITQANGSNPKIRQLGTQDALGLSAIADRTITQVFRVRIVRDGVDPKLIDPKKVWTLSFDGGSTQVPCRVIPPIRESRVQGVSWEIDLELTRNV